MQHQILINVIIFVAYVLNLLPNTQRSHSRSQRTGKWSLILAYDRRPIYRAPTYIVVPLLGPHQPQYIGLTLYCEVTQTPTKPHLGYSRLLYCEVTQAPTKPQLGYSCCIVKSHRLPLNLSFAIVVCCIVKSHRLPLSLSLAIVVVLWSHTGSH